MARYFTCYWKNEFCRDETREEFLTYVAGSQFIRRGVRPQDTIYIVTIKTGELYLPGRMEVGEICDREAAALWLDCSPAELWDAPEYLVAKKPTRLCYSRYVPFDLTCRLRFLSAKGLSLPLKFREPGYLDSQTLRSFRKLTPASAKELDIFLQHYQ